MQDQFDLVVVSTFGRGNWIAFASQKLGMKVALVDVTEKMGSWSLEETEGPLGIFMSEKFHDTQMERLQEDDSPYVMPNGFTIWLPTGPVELKGPVAKHRLQRLAVPEEVIQYVSSAAQEVSSVREGLRNRLKEMPFRQTWLAQLSHSLVANRSLPATEALNVGRPVPLFSTYQIRYPTRRGHQKGLEWCQRSGVKVFEKAGLQDASFSDLKTLQTLEMKIDQSEKTTLISGQQFIFSLTSEEVAMLGANLSAALFKGRHLEPEWCWSRFRTRISDCPEREVLPNHLLIIQDIGLPWTHENFIILQKTPTLGTYDAWIKLPHVQRFNKSYLINRGEKLLQTLIGRLPSAVIEIDSYPSGFEATYSQVGPARFPVYNQFELQQFGHRKFGNVQFDSPEQWDSLSWDSRFYHGNQLFKLISTWWLRLLQKRRKHSGEDVEI